MILLEDIDFPLQINRELPHCFYQRGNIGVALSKENFSELLRFRVLPVGVNDAVNRTADASTNLIKMRRILIEGVLEPDKVLEIYIYTAHSIIIKGETNKYGLFMLLSV